MPPFSEKYFTFFVAKSQLLAWVFFRKVKQDEVGKFMGPFLALCGIGKVNKPLAAWIRALWQNMFNGDRFVNVGCAA